MGRDSVEVVVVSTQVGSAVEAKYSLVDLMQSFGNHIGLPNNRANFMRILDGGSRVVTKVNCVCSVFALFLQSPHSFQLFIV